MVKITKPFCHKVYHPVPVPCQLKQEEDSTVTMKVLPALLLVGLFAANQNLSLFWSFYDFGLSYSSPFNWKHIKCFELFFPLLVLLFIPRPLPSSLTAVCRLAGKDRPAAGFCACAVPATAVSYLRVKKTLTKNLDVLI